MDSAIERLQDTVTDGRGENVRFRQTQLQRLHEGLRDEATALCAALARDAPSTSDEVEAEFFLAMDAVRHAYDGLDFEKSLEQEYAVARGQNNETRRIAAGLVVVRPTSHTRLYSVLAPLAAALAAGCCVVLELQDTLLQVDALLRTLLPKCLDPNMFCISKTIIDRDILQSATLVDQTGGASDQKNEPAASKELVSPVRARVVAVVDRTANVEAAARAITTARFAFGGQSPYAPDLVLVNEWVKKDFFEACSRFATLAFARDSAVKKVSGNESDEVRRAIKEAEDKRQVTAFGSSDFKLVDVKDKNAALMNMKISGRFLPIATCSSLTDAVSTQTPDQPLLAGYFFAAPEAAKYLAQFLPCHVSCVNQIPAHLLVGPAAPVSGQPDFYYRYSRDMFSVPRPQFAERSPAPFADVEALLLASDGGGTDKAQKLAARGLRARAVAPLRLAKIPDTRMLGFFERGIFTGLGICLSLIVPVLGYGAYFTSRKAFEFATRSRH